MKTIRAIDLFCGAGGTSTGLSQACDRIGAKLALTAINHWDIAVETHAANHPVANHLCETLDNINPTKLAGMGKLDLLIASPECTHHSTARGGKPINDQSRASAWHVVRWADALRPRTIIVENVREFQGWGPLNDRGRPLKRQKGRTFGAWVQALESLGYMVRYAMLTAADYGDPTTRERLFIVATRGRKGASWPIQTHAKDGGGSDGLFAAALPRWRAAREVIDWSIKGESIFGRKRPLSTNTLKRIAAGLRKFCGLDFTVDLRGTKESQVNGSARSVDDPLSTVTGGNHHVVCQPFIVPTNYGERPGQSPRTHSVDDPLPTVVGTATHGLVEPFIVHTTHHGQRRPHSVSEPLPTVTGAHRGEMAVVEPFILGQQSGSVPRSCSDPLPTISTDGAISLIEPFVMQMSQSGSNGDRLRSCDRPYPTITTADDLALIEPFLVAYYGTGGALSVDAPLDTITARDRFGLVNGSILDIRFRMLQPHELAAAMSFPKDYVFKGTREQRVKQIGNAVPVRLAEALCFASLTA